MKKILFMLAVIAFATSAQAVIINTPSPRQEMPVTSNVPAAAPIQTQPGVQINGAQAPLYYENGRPVYTNSQAQTNGKVQNNNCQDKGGNYIPCPAAAPVNAGAK